MKKRICAVALMFILLISLAACGGDVSEAGRRVDESKVYVEEDIIDAMDTVTSHFKKNFKGCKLISLEYDEEISLKAAVDWAEQYEADEAIVLVSSFEVDSSGGDGSLNPDSTYNDWQWILTRNDGGKWTLQTYGY